MTTENFYWANRIIAAIADPHFNDNVNTIDNYRERTMAFGQRVLRETDARVAALAKAGAGTVEVEGVLEESNQRVADELREETDKLLDKVLYTSSMLMKNSFSLSDH